jgi:hypothetical protein
MWSGLWPACGSVRPRPLYCPFLEQLLPKIPPTSSVLPAPVVWATLLVQRPGVVFPVLPGLSLLMPSSLLSFIWLCDQPSI